MGEWNGTAAVRRAHSFFGPSSLERIDRCPGSVALAMELEELGWRDTESSDIASRGTRIHAYAAEFIKNPIKDFTGEDVIEEEVEFARTIADFAQRECDRIEGLSDADVMVEEPLEFAEMPGDEPLYYGTSDLIVLDRVNGEVLVCDWKTGMKEVTEAANNLQGAAYALAAMQKFRMPKAHVVFFNPCINQLTEAWFDDMQGLADEITAIIYAAKEKDARCNAGAHCQYCPARKAGFCATYLATVTTSTALAVMPDRLPLPQWSDEKVAQWHEIMQNAERFKDEIDKELSARIARNGSCAGYGFKSSPGGREAKDIFSIVTAVQDVLTQDDVMGCCTLSLPKTEALFAERMKGSGKSKTLKEGKALFKELSAPYVTDKPERQCIVPLQD